jgi:hypothetical protein
MEEHRKISVTGKTYITSPSDSSTIVNKKHYEMLSTSEFKLSFTEEGFVNIHYKEDGKSVREPLHRYIMAKLEKIIIPEGNLVTHKNGIKYDNSFSNLSIVTKDYISASSKAKKENNTSQYKGVTFHKLTNKWMSRIKYQGKKINLGYFVNEDDAGKKYDMAYVSIHGNPHGSNGLLTNEQIQQINQDPDKYKPRGKNELRGLPSNIQKKNSSYAVQFRKEGINKNFKTLEEAVEFRNEIMKNRN